MIKINFKNKKRFTLSLSNGFTLVETLVAITIFTTSILALMTILSNGISSTTYAKQKITAEYMAGEGVEYMRNMRDTFILYSSVSGTNGWNAFKSKLSLASCNQPNGCYFNSATLNYSSNAPLPMTEMTITPGSSISGNFRRTINAEFVGNDEVKIYSKVSWTKGGSTYSITFSTQLFNWIEEI